MSSSFLTASLIFAASVFKKKPPVTKQLRIVPPRPDPGRHGIAIVSCVRNEAAYIADWILFHRAVGVRHFYIYDDGSSDATCDIVRSVAKPGEVTILPWSGRVVDANTEKMLNSQTIAFAHAIANYGSGYRWMAFIDVDEFLLPKKGATIEEALVGVDGFPNVSLPWHMFGPGGHKDKPEGSVLKNYTKRAATPIGNIKKISNFKCMVDPCEVSDVSVHYFCTRQYGEVSSNDSGQKATIKGRKLPDFYSSQYLQLNHYYSKSEAELREKIARGPLSPASRSRYEAHSWEAVRNIELSTVEDRAMLAFLEEHKIGLNG